MYGLCDDDDDDDDEVKDIIKYKCWKIRFDKKMRAFRLITATGKGMKRSFKVR